MASRFGCIALALAMAMAMACGDDDDPPDGPDASTAAVSFAADIAPIFAAKCNDCHHPGSAIGYDLTNPFDPDTGIINRENSWRETGHASEETVIVDPGNVDNSFLIVKVTEVDPLGEDGALMPYQLELLTDAELADVEQWIAGGANNDASFEAVAEILGTEISLRPSLSGKCTWCHYPGSPNGLNVLNVFDPEEGMVGVDSLYGGKIVEPGDPANSALMKKLRGTEAGPQMPLHHSRLGAAEVQLLRDWIIAGAPDN